MESGKSQDISNKRTHIFADPAPWAVYANGSLWGHSGRELRLRCGAKPFSR